MTLSKFDKKAVWMLLAMLLAIPYVICSVAAWLQVQILKLGEATYKWSHPEKFGKNRMPRRQS